MDEADTIAIACPECGNTGELMDCSPEEATRVFCGCCYNTTAYSRWKKVEVADSEVPSVGCYIGTIDMIGIRRKIDKCATCVDGGQRKDKAKIVVSMVEFAFELEEMADSQPNTEAAEALEFCAKRIREILR